MRRNKQEISRERFFSKESQLDLSVVNGMLLKLRARHLIIAALIDRVEVNKNYEVKVFFKVSAEQFLGKAVRIA